MSSQFIYIQSHPIQYNAPLFAMMTGHDIKIDVLYLSNEGVEESFDVQFGRKIKWDIPLLSGYNHEFLKNHSIIPSIHNGFLGLINLGLIHRLKKSPKSIVIVPGWNYASYWIAIFAAKFYGHKLAIRCESPQNQEVFKNGVMSKSRKFLVKSILLSKIDFALFIGMQNYHFYRNNGVAENKLYFFPYSVDNSRFQESYMELKTRKIGLRAEMGIDEISTVILYSGKLISKKRPMDLLKAFVKLRALYPVQLIFVGDGVLRGEMEEFIAVNSLKNSVKLIGFVNQSEIVKYYSIADIFVMTSGVGETWGLSVNEAMNFFLKLVVSDLTGSSIDLVIKNKTGWIFESGNINDLRDKLNLAISSSNFNCDEYKYLLKKFSFQTAVENLKKITAT